MNSCTTEATGSDHGSRSSSCTELVIKSVLNLTNLRKIRKRMREFLFPLGLSHVFTFVAHNELYAFMSRCPALHALNLSNLRKSENKCFSSGFGFARNLFPLERPHFFTFGAHNDLYSFMSRCLTLYASFCREGTFTIGCRWLEMYPLSPPKDSCQLA